MCGIVGYIGSRRASDVLLGGLSRLEYRGYDSAGVAVLEDDQLTVVRRVGKLVNLKNARCRRPRSAAASASGTRAGRPTGAPPRRTPTRTPTARADRGRPQRHHRELRRAARGARGQRPHASQRDRHRGDRPPHRELLRRATSSRRWHARSKDLEGSFALAVVHADDPSEIVAVAQGVAADHRGRRRREHRRERRPRGARVHARGARRWTTATWRADAPTA